MQETPKPLSGVCRKLEYIEGVGLVLITSDKKYSRTYAYRWTDKGWEPMRRAEEAGHQQFEPQPPHLTKEEVGLITSATKSNKEIDQQS